MNLNENRMWNLMIEFCKSINGNVNEEHIKKFNTLLQQLDPALQETTENISFFTEEINYYISKTKESEKLSQSEFQEKYSFEMEACKQLGRAGWVISEHSNPRGVKEWYDFLSNKEDTKIITYFEGNNGRILYNIYENLEHRYSADPNKKYFSNAKYYFEQEDYMTAAIYLVALVEARINALMNYTKKATYKQKYSTKGFENYLKTEFSKANPFFTKRFLFLQMYPSIIEFLNRLFVDGKYTFENNVEPPYINRNWLLHGRNCKVIERYECIQLFNALSVIEFVFSVDYRSNTIE